MNDVQMIHLLIDIVLIVVSAFLASSLSYIDRRFKNTIFFGSWRLVLYSTILLFVGALIDIMLGISQIIPAWTAIIFHIFTIAFLVCLCYGLDSMAREWKKLVSTRK